MCVRGLCFPLELWWSIYSLAVTRMCLSDGGRGIYSTCIRDLSLFSVERTLSRCDVRDVHLVNIYSQMPLRKDYPL